MIEYHQASDATTLPQSVEKHHLPARKLGGSKSLPVGRPHQYQPLAIATVNATRVNDLGASRSRELKGMARGVARPYLNEFDSARGAGSALDTRYA